MDDSFPRAAKTLELCLGSNCCILLNLLLSFWLQCHQNPKAVWNDAEIGKLVEHFWLEHEG